MQAGFGEDAIDAGRVAPVPSFSLMRAHPHQWLALVGGIGLMRVWPGTWGTAVGVPLFFLLQDLPPLARGVAYAVLIAAGAWAAARTGDDLGLHDHNAIVVDETVGMALTLELFGWAMGAPGWGAVLVGFVLFRLFDSTKPFPIRLIDRRMNGGFGVILDDLWAAAYAAIALILVMRVF